MEEKIIEKLNNEAKVFMNYYKQKFLKVRGMKKHIFPKIFFGNAG